MDRQLGRAEFAKLFTTFTDSAFRLETLTAYREPHEADAVSRFAAGLPPDDTWASDYLDLLRSLPSNGRRVERVRVLDVPPTEYQRFVMDLAARCNVPAGEQLRVLDRPDAAALGVPLDEDFWLFDNQVVATLHFVDGTFTHAILVTDPAKIAHLRAIRRRTWEAAQPNREREFAVHR
ncbi:DUF6879 family protein [Actinokineospora sp.]|uniref:DUF6879 family protein n=1 Tax=Actinokineospora sp. TaxID=1872133 RepID=UPI0040381CFC